jgi:hypothetical protein
VLLNRVGVDRRRRDMHRYVRDLDAGNKAFRAKQTGEIDSQAKARGTPESDLP